MNPSQEDAPVGNGSLAGSQTQLINPQPSRGGSNSRALKIAGLTTLACALLASQIFTALMVFDQNKQIEDLHRKSERLGKDFTRSSRAVPPSRMQTPLRSLPMVMDFAVDGETKKVEEAKPPTPEPVVSVEEQLKGFIQDFEPPHFNQTFMDNLEGLKSQFTEEEWKSFESWMRYWLVFKMAQHKPAPPTESPTTPSSSASSIMTKCQEEAAPGHGRIGSFRPQCDEHGNYKPRQCWHATGFCWCVDKTGKVIEGTAIRGLPQCDGGRSYSRMMPAPSMINLNREN